MASRSCFSSHYQGWILVTCRQGEFADIFQEKECGQSARDKLAADAAYTVQNDISPRPIKRSMPIKLTFDKHGGATVSGSAVCRPEYAFSARVGS